MSQGNVRPNTVTTIVASCATCWPGSVSERLHGIIDASGDAVTKVPRQRWDAASSVGHLSGAQSDSVQHGSFLSGVERFDCGFFGISRAEAAAMDPQQRLLLEVGYTSFASAHLRRAALMHSSTGIYLGIMNVDYQLSGIASTNVFAATSRSPSIAAGRLSVSLGLNGACLSIDSACP